MKRYYATISIKVELEADTYEDASLLLHDWVEHVAEHDYVEPISFQSNLIQEMIDGKEEGKVEDTTEKLRALWKKANQWFYQGDPYP